MRFRSSRGCATRPSRSPWSRLDTKKNSSASARQRGPRSSHTCRATRSSTSRSRSRTNVSVQSRYRKSPSLMRMPTMRKKRSPHPPTPHRTSWTTRRRRIHVHGHRQRQRHTPNGVGSFKSSVDNERWICICLQTFQTVFPEGCAIPSELYPRRS